MCFSFLILLLVGCTNKEDVRVSSSEVENKFIKLEQKIEMLQASIDEHEDKFNGMNELDTDTLNENMDMLEEFDAYLYNQIYLLENIIKQTTLHKTAMLNSAEIDGNTLNINVTYTSKLIDDEFHVFFKDG